MTGEPEEPGRPHNLYEPLPGDWGARGRFSDQAYDRSEQWLASQNRGWLALAAGVAVGWAAAALADGGGHNRRVRPSENW